MHQTGRPDRAPHNPSKIAKDTLTNLQFAMHTLGLMMVQGREFTAAEEGTVKGESWNKSAAVIKEFRAASIPGLLRSTSA